MNKITISIITVTYNAQATLERTIKSVCEQSYGGIEYVIIDGASKDSTIEIIKRYDTQISHWVSEPDGGLYDAMNKGIQMATGDYIWFLNAGDTLKNNDIVQQVIDMANKHNLPHIIYGETDLVDIADNYLGARRLKAPEQLTWKSFRVGMLVCHQAFIMKRTEAPFYDLRYRFSADFDWCIRCMKQGGTIVNSHLRLVNYLYEGLTTHNRKTSLKERYAIMVKFYGRIPVVLLHLWFAVRFYWAQWTKKVI